jgi:hypothetical protein
MGCTLSEAPLAVPLAAAPSFLAIPYGLRGFL